MCDVIQLAERRAKANKTVRRPLDRSGPQYYCLRCDADQFKVYASGLVHCGSCGSLMRNLLLSLGTATN